MRAIYVVVPLVLVLFGYLFWTSGQDATNGDVATEGAALVDVVVPQSLSGEAEIGKRGFETNCAVCHGINAAGRDGAGPPLVHVIYEPNHHGDQAFYLAAMNGVRQHHWPFGDMPAVPGVTQAELKDIVTYVREIQSANGIN